MPRTGACQTLQRHPCGKYIADSLNHGYFEHWELRTALRSNCLVVTQAYAQMPNAQCTIANDQLPKQTLFIISYKLDDRF